MISSRQQRPGLQVASARTAKTTILAAFAAALLWPAIPAHAGDLLTRCLTVAASGQVRSIADRRTADGLLKKARQAVEAGNVELAEWYVSRAEALNVTYDSIFNRYVETPENVRQAIEHLKSTDSQMENLDEAVVDAQSTVEGVIEQASGVKATNAAKDQAAGFLAKGRVALEHGELGQAIGWYQSAIATGATFRTDEYSPRSLAAALREQGVPAGQLAKAASESRSSVAAAIPDSLLDPAKVGGVAGASKTSANSLLERGIKINSSTLEKQRARYAQERSETLRLLAEAELALDRGELATAETLAQRAKDLRVPDVVYEAGDKRPWMLLMEVNRRKERIGNYASAPQTPAGLPQAPAGLPQAPAGLTQTDRSRNVLASGELAAPTASLAVADGPATEYQSAQPNQRVALQSKMVYPDVPVAPDLSSTPLPLDPTSPTAIGSGRNMTVPGYGSTDTSTTMDFSPQTPDYGAQLDLTAETPAVSPDLIPAETVRQEMVQSPPTSPMAPTTIDSPIEQAPLSLQTSTNNRPAVPTGSPVPAAPSASDLNYSNEETPGGLAPVVETPRRPPVSPSQLEAPPLAPAGDIASGNQQPANPRLEQPPPPAAVGLIAQGERALSQQDFERARSLFLEAWRYESSLDVDSRQRLQDLLQVVRSEDNPVASRGPAPPSGDEPAEPGRLSNVDKDKVRRLLADISRQQVSINSVREEDPMAAWEKLKKLKQFVAEADVDESSRNRLLSRVDRATREMESYIETNRGRIENDARNKALLEEIKRIRQQRERNDIQLAEFVEEFNTLIDQQRFPEAGLIAKRSAEIDPSNPVVQSMLWKAQVARQLANQYANSQRYQERVADALNEVDPTPMSGNIEFPTAFEWGELTRRRKEGLADARREFSETELEIQRALKEPVDVYFEDEPLSSVLEKLSQVAGINMFLDPSGLTAEGVTSDTVVSIKLPNPVSLKSALNLILAPLHLSYVVQDEVLRVTSEQVRAGDVQTRVYNVADLVIPIPNFSANPNVGLPAALREAYDMIPQNQYQGGYNRRPFLLNQDGDGGNSSAIAQLAGANQLGQFGLPGGAPQNASVSTGGGASGQAGGGAQADFDTLIDLITTTVSPESWEEVGGTGSLQGFPTNLSLVVAQTQEVHERIADLLAQLRRLQDLQVTIEVRFITLNDDFFERIGVDFDFDIDDNTGLSLAEQQALDDDGPSVTVGLDPSGLPTVDLDVGFEQGGFGVATPAFGGYQATNAATLGFAILSDIEAFFVIEASQGDTRTNVLQAPKVTLFNGQQAFVADQSQRPFVSSIIPVVGDFAAAHQPVITVLTEGTSLSVQAVVSQDRRFVRLTLVPFFSQIGDVDTFTFEGDSDSDTGTNVIDPSDDTNTVVNNATNRARATTVQLPTFAFTSVTTTVSVPDGGTILLGGIKRLTEGRTEQGVPMLSKLPYINRLFRNVGIGRETQSLMMMVTPRIIIQEEEEEKLGLNLNP